MCYRSEDNDYAYVCLQENFLCLFAPLHNLKVFIFLAYKGMEKYMHCGVKTNLDEKKL